MLSSGAATRETSSASSSWAARAPCFAGGPGFDDQLGPDWLYQPLHQTLVDASVDHWIRKVTSVREVLRRQCLREALLDWRDRIAEERLDARLGEATKVVQRSLDLASSTHSAAAPPVRRRRSHRLHSQDRDEAANRRSHRPQSQDQDGAASIIQASFRSVLASRRTTALLRQLHAIDAARGAARGSAALARSLGRLRDRQLLAGMAKWKRLLVPQFVQIVENAFRPLGSCPALTWNVLGASEDELCAQLLCQGKAAVMQRATQQAARRDEKQRLLTAARLLRLALLGPQQRALEPGFTGLRIWAWAAATRQRQNGQESSGRIEQRDEKVERPRELIIAEGQTPESRSCSLPAKQSDNPSSSSWGASGQGTAPARGPMTHCAEFLPWGRRLLPEKSVGAEIAKQDSLRAKPVSREMAGDLRQAVSAALKEADASSLSSPSTMEPAQEPSRLHRELEKTASAAHSRRSNLQMPEDASLPIGRLSL
eukprot:TRINITY_DN89406_c0_g1_i1.p1 TRINITY_DN89406_c0_g1~~TRINITY_DN89406_c0_g1_i1.p1  ORF type:complete len:484 (+),score=80.10 TRINITY_DN89406_c0_g1_i1:260-1711(+)